MSWNDALSVADRLFRAIEAGDIATVHELYAPDVEIRVNVWHGRANEVQTREQNVAVLQWVVTNLRDLRYDEIRRSATDTGFVQQHVFRAVSPSGQQLEVPVCMVGTCVDGHITRLDEYMDSAHIADLIRRPSNDG
jgi:ketosteroid isomerase-like protein